VYGFHELKEQLEVTASLIGCPVQNCEEIVRRRRKGDKASPDFICPVHHLDISPSTFSYESETDNMLWADASDLALFNSIKKVKRESRINANNSEDAVSWNVFRYLERAGLLGSAITSMTGIQLVSPRIVYWSWAQQSQDQDKGGDWKGLNRARLEFGETVARGSEPDIIVIGDNAIVFIEAKLTAPNDTTPSRSEVESGYVKGGGSWFEKVFTESFQTIAIDAKKYELLRFWLLGTWLANDLDVDFHLVNLVLADRETAIEEKFGKLMHQRDSSHFSRCSWEDIWRFVAKVAPESSDRAKILDYFENRTIGYRDGVLQRAFSS